MAKLSSLVWTPPWSAVSWHRFGIKAPTSWCTPKRLCTKSRNSTCGAPKARNMIARGKRRAQRDASPLDHNQVDYEALKERNTTDDISHFQCSLQFISHNQGRRVSLCSPLAPCYHISRLWRSVHRIPTFCAKLSKDVRLPERREYDSMRSNQLDLAEKQEEFPCNCRSSAGLCVGSLFWSQLF